MRPAQRLAHRALVAFLLLLLVLQCRCTPPAPLRVWIDQYAWHALAETQLLREAVAASGGTAVLAGETRSAVIQLKGYQQLHKLDVYWTSREVRRSTLDTPSGFTIVPTTGSAANSVPLCQQHEPWCCLATG